MEMARHGAVPAHGDSVMIILGATGAPTTVMVPGVGRVDIEIAFMINAIPFGLIPQALTLSTLAL